MDLGLRSECRSDIPYTPDLLTRMPSSSYTGYIDIEARHLFFYFSESRNNPAKDDVIFWTSGGQWFLQHCFLGAGNLALEIASLSGCKPFR
jgi:hypothetical protein